MQSEKEILEKELGIWENTLKKLLGIAESEPLGDWISTINSWKNIIEEQLATAAPVLKTWTGKFGTKSADEVDKELKTANDAKDKAEIDLKKLQLFMIAWIKILKKASQNQKNLNKAIIRCWMN